MRICISVPCDITKYSELMAVNKLLHVYRRNGYEILHVERKDLFTFIIFKADLFKTIRFLKAQVFDRNDFVIRIREKTICVIPIECVLKKEDCD